MQVYEIHARMALESVRSCFGNSPAKFIDSFLTQSDMVEYNQCQATLRTLYELGIPGKVEEFTAYRILMLLHGRNRSGMLSLQDVVVVVALITQLAELNLFVGQLTPRQKADPAVRHALGVQRALSMGNYHSLFEAYMAAPNMGAYIMDHFIDRERVKALMVITKALVSVLCLALDFL